MSSDFKYVNVVLTRSNPSEMNSMEDRGREACFSIYLYVLWTLLGHVTGKQRKKAAEVFD